MKIKELQKTVNVAWSPHQLYPIYLAAGSAAQQIDSSGHSVLEIYSPDIKEPSYDLALKASLPSQYRFQKLIWSPTGYNGTHPKGLLIGGCESGHLMVYSAAKMLNGEEGLIAEQDSHTGPVRGLDFNPFQTNLLASVASESEVFVWDLNNTSTHMTPGAKTQPLEDVQNVAWNRQVQHILASVFSSRCVIWDLRKNEQIIKLMDTQSRVRWRAVQWHPEVATQIWLASEEDQAPIVQMWDLRYATAPAKAVQIHQRGVLSMSWCPKDPDMMVSCGKDNRIYCWNPNSELAEGEILSEVAITKQWYSDVQWCPRDPTLIASSSPEGNVSIYSVFGGVQEQVQTSNKIADSFPGMDQFTPAPVPSQVTQVTHSDPTRPPKWMKKTSGVKFGFGGKLLTFDSSSKSVQIHQVTTEPDLVARAEALEKVLIERNFIEFCRSRADQVNEHNRYLWYFLKANFEACPKEEMLNLLGYNGEDINAKFAKYVKEEDTTHSVDQITNRMATLTHQPGDHSQIFDTIAAENKGYGDFDEKDTKEGSIKIPSGEDPDSLVCEAIITGNLEAAVQLCLDSDRPAEALIIASTAGIEFLTRIQNRYLKQKNSELSNVISALVSRNWGDLISRCTTDSWKEALVAVLKHSDRKIDGICEKLGDRLLTESSNIQDIRNAILCYICAGSADKLIEAWYLLKKQEKSNDQYELSNEELQELAEVVMVLSKSLELQGIAVEPEGKFAEFVSQYGVLLVGQGAINAAKAYVFALGSTTHEDLNDLRDRFSGIVSQKEEISRVPQTQNPQQGHIQTQMPPVHSYRRESNPIIQPTFSPAPMQNTFNTGLPSGNQWNQPPQSNVPMPIQLTPPTPMFSNQPQNISNLNPGITPAMPPQTKPVTASQISESLARPPRPSSVSSQGSTSLPSKGKYLLDPSVSSGPSYGNVYNPPPTVPPTNFNTTPFATNQSYQTSNVLPASGSVISNLGASTIPQMQNNYVPLNPMQSVQQNSYLPGAPPVDTSQTMSPPPPVTHAQRNPTPPPGWNDPPMLKSARQQPKKADAAPPITHPLFGTDPNMNMNQNGYIDPNVQYQNQGMPPPPSIGQQMPPNQTPYNPNQTPYNPNQTPYNPNQVNNNQFPGQMNFQPNAVPQVYQQQQYNTGYADPPLQMGQETQMQQIQRNIQPRQPEPPKEKAPLPEEYIYMQTVFEELKNHCLSAATDPRTKRKFTDVNKRLENLYDCLREGKLTPTTLSALNQIVQCIQIGDYSNALATHTTIAFGTDFAHTAGFMPGIKVLVQSALEMKIYLR